MITGDVIEQLPGKPVVDSQGQEVGPVDDVFTFSGSTDAAASIASRRSLSIKAAAKPPS